MRQENNINTLKLQNYKTPKLQNSNIADSCGSTAGAASWTRRESLASSGNLHSFLVLIRLLRVDRGVIRCGS